MSKIKDFFCGAVRFNVLCVNAALINRLRFFCVRNIKINGGYISFTVPVLYAEQIKRELRNFEYSFTENANIIRGVNFMLNRFVLSVSILICCAAYFVADLFVYSVRITGGTEALQGEIYAYLTQNGIKKFALKRRVVNFNIIDGVVRTFPTVAHANIKIYGNTAVIAVAEAESNLVPAPQNFYAKYDAVIKEIFVAGGAAKVAVGDVVRAGDLLVENGYPGKVVIIGEVRFDGKETDFYFDMNIV
jgi:hypothetical protein